MTKYLIIGNGAAGVAAAERIRGLDRAGEITILSAEGQAVYSRCLLPDFISGQLPAERMYIRQRDFYEKKRIGLQLDQRAVEIDPQRKQVITAGAQRPGEEGAVFNYDKLLIATGSVPILPPIAGLDPSRAHFLATFADAERIIADAKTARRIVVIGAGFVGLETAANLYKLGKEVTVIERMPRVLYGQLDEKAAQIIRHSFEAEGIRLALGAGVAAVSTALSSRLMKLMTGTDVKSVVLDDGRQFNAEMIVVAAGSRPNLDFVRDTSVTIRRGIVVDQQMRTAVEDIYAAGDVVESIDAVTGEASLSPIWPNAVLQGEVAAYNMTGVPRTLPELISMQNVTEFREVPLMSMGIVDPPDSGYEVLCDYRPAEGIYRKLVLKDDRVVGMIFLGDIHNSGVIGALIKNRTPVGKIKANMLNRNFGYSEVAA